MNSRTATRWVVTGFSIAFIAVANTIPSSAALPPQCSVDPVGAPIGQTITATGFSGIPPYSWNMGGGSPNTYSNTLSATTAYASVGTKTITIGDSAGSSGTCTVIIGTGFVSAGTTTTAQGQPGIIDFNTDYTVRLTVWDANGTQSTVTLPYRTKNGPWVQPAFSFLPAQPAAGQPVTFTDETDYQGSSKDGISWDFGDGSLLNTTDLNPTHTYATELNNVSVTLKARSSIMTPGEYCTVTSAAPFNILKPIPGYREVLPGSQTAPQNKPSSSPTRTPTQTTLPTQTVPPTETPGTGGYTPPPDNPTF